MTEPLNLDGPRFDGYALCAETDPEAFFPDVGGTTVPAKKVCRRCEVIDQCLAWALTHDERGVWGGTSEQQRRYIKARRAAA